MKNEDLNAEERRKEIVALVKEQGKVKVVDLSKKYNISEVSIRNDLTELESMGEIERVHGGAISTNKAYYNMAFNERMVTNKDEKRKIAIAAAALISEGDTILINSGTTSLYFVEEILNIQNITLVTNSLFIAQTTANHANINVILLGGNFCPKHQFTYGHDAITQLRTYKADKLILSVDGVSAEDGITIYHYLEADICKEMLLRSKKSIIVADYSKIGRSSFSNIGKIENIDILFTNENANNSELDLIKEYGVEIKYG